MQGIFLLCFKEITLKTLQEDTQIFGRIFFEKSQDRGRNSHISLSLLLHNTVFYNFKLLECVQKTQCPVSIHKISQKHFLHVCPLYLKYKAVGYLDWDIVYKIVMSRSDSPFSYNKFSQWPLAFACINHIYTSQVQVVLGALVCLALIPCLQQVVSLGRVD